MNDNVIADVSLTLQELLKAALVDLISEVKVHDLQNMNDNELLLTLFLYEIIEDPSARNRPRIQGMAQDQINSQKNVITLSKPPMALLLRYLVTPWSGNQITDQQILGRVLRVLYDDALIDGPQLLGELGKSNQALKVTLAQLTLEERARIWNSVHKAFKLSLVYEVRVVNLDSSSQTMLQPVKRRSLKYKEPEASL